MNDYVKISVDIKNHWLWTDKPFAKGQALIDIALLGYSCNKDVIPAFKCRWATDEQGTIKIKVAELADRWGWSYKRTRNFITGWGVGNGSLHPTQPFKASIENGTATITLNQEWFDYE